MEKLGDLCLHGASGSMDRGEGGAASSGAILLLNTRVNPKRQYDVTLRRPTCSWMRALVFYLLLLLRDRDCGRRSSGSCKSDFFFFFLTDEDKDEAAGTSKARVSCSPHDTQACRESHALTLRNRPLLPPPFPPHARARTGSQSGGGGQRNRQERHSDEGDEMND